MGTSVAGNLFSGPVRVKAITEGAHRKVKKQCAPRATKLGGGSDDRRPPSGLLRRKLRGKKEQQRTAGYEKGAMKGRLMT